MHFVTSYHTRYVGQMKCTIPKKLITPISLCGRYYLCIDRAGLSCALCLPAPPVKHKVTAAATATKDACCAANTWEIFDEQSKGMDQGNADEGVYGGAGSKAETGGEETAIERQAGELATVTLARCAVMTLPAKYATMSGE